MKGCEIMTIRKLYNLGIIGYRDKVFVIYNNSCLHDGVYYCIPSQYMDIPLGGYTVMYQSPWGAQITAWLIRDSTAEGGE